MARYEILFRKSTKKDLRSIEKSEQVKILRKVADLADDPRPYGCKKLSGRDRYRIRHGNFRILYAIEDRKLLITVVKIGNRKNVYDD